MDKQQRAERARAILNDDLFQEAVEQVRDRHKQAVLSGEPFNDGLHLAHAKLWAVEQIIGELQSVLDDEAMATKRKGKPRGSQE